MKKCLGLPKQIISVSLGFHVLYGASSKYPVKNLTSRQIEITSQNHGFAVKMESLPETLEMTHLNLYDNTVEGVKHRELPCFSVQYHPEAAPGPHDSHYLFEQFVKLMDQAKN